jgi:hypothetical protein
MCWALGARHQAGLGGRLKAPGGASRLDAGAMCGGQQDRARSLATVPQLSHATRRAGACSCDGHNTCVLPCPRARSIGLCCKCPLTCLLPHVSPRPSSRLQVSVEGDILAEEAPRVVLRKEEPALSMSRQVVAEMMIMAGEALGMLGEYTGPLGWAG